MSWWRSVTSPKLSLRTSVTTSHVTCLYAVFLQDCELHYVSDKPCGLGQTEHVSWTAFNHYVSSLPDCTTGYEPGRDWHYNALHRSRSLKPRIASLGISVVTVTLTSVQKRGSGFWSYAPSIGSSGKAPAQMVKNKASWSRKHFIYIWY